MDTTSISTFSIAQAADMTGITQNRLREWHDKGLLLDSQKISVGSRIHRRFTKKDIELISLIIKYQGDGFGTAVHIGHKALNIHISDVLYRYVLESR